MSADAGLARQAARAVGWGAAGSVVKLGLQFGLQIVLARLLGPEQYGLFAIGVLVVSLASFLSDFGMAYGLIQKPQVSEDDLRCVFTWQVVIGLGVALAVALGAGSIAQAFGEPRAAGVVAALAPVCLLNAMAAPSLNLLKRRLDFRRLQLAQLGGYAAGYLACGLPLAWALGDVRALVVAWLVQSAVTLAGLYRAVRHPLRPLWNTPDRPVMLSTGLTVMATNLLNWLLQNVDRAVVAQRYAARSVGGYSAAFNLVYTPTTTLLGVLQPVLHAAGGRLERQDGEPLARVYRAVLLGVSVLLAPLYAAAAVLAGPIIALLYGPAWQEAASLLAPFALAMPAFLVWGLSTPVLWAAGRARQEFRSQLPVLLLWLLVCAAASRGPVIGVAWSVAGLFIVRAATMVVQVARALAMPGAALRAVLLPGLVAAAAVALTCLALSSAARALGLSEAALAVPALLLGWAGGLLPVLAWLKIPRDLLPLLQPLRQRLPGVLQRARPWHDAPAGAR